MRDALIELFRNAAAACHNGFQISFDRAGNLETVILSMLRIVQDLCRTQQRLGRDTAPIETDPAQVFALDDSCL